MVVFGALKRPSTPLGSQRSRGTRRAVCCESCGQYPDPSSHSLLTLLGFIQPQYTWEPSDGTQTLITLTSHTTWT
eukprot:3667598-Rhodomonas_salina.1